MVLGQFAFSDAHGFTEPSAVAPDARVHSSGENGKINPIQASVC